jgi:hypothetical protein
MTKYFIHTPNVRKTDKQVNMNQLHVEVLMQIFSGDQNLKNSKQKDFILEYLG